MAALTTRVSLLDPKRLDLLNLRVKEVNANLERQAALRQQQPAAAAEMDQKVWKGSFFFGGGTWILALLTRAGWALAGAASGRADQLLV